MCWWELRRIAYNLIVGCVGLVTVTTMTVTSLICDKAVGVPISLPDPPIFAVVGIIVYGVMANVCFTGGWLVELFIAGAWGLRPARFGPIAFSLGLLGSVILTLLPACLTVVFATVTLLFHSMGMPLE